MNRRLVGRIAALLVICQMVMGPFAYAFVGGPVAGGCAHAGTVHPWHADDGCGEPRNAGGGASTHHHPHATHQCHCVHAVSLVPIVGSPYCVVSVATTADAITGRLRGPAYSAPLFELLRPPN